MSGFVLASNSWLNLATDVADVKTLVLLSFSFKRLSTIYKTTLLYWLSVKQTVMGATCVLSFHPEDDHPAVADGDHPMCLVLHILILSLFKKIMSR